MEKSRDFLPVDKAGSVLTGVRGEMLTFTADPFLTNPEKCYLHYADGLIVIQDGIILEVGDYKEIHPHYPGLKNIDHHKDAVIMPGFVDCHIHYVQSPMIGSFGDTLLTWLNEYTFPTESRYKDKDFADCVAKEFFKQILEQGTTTANAFSTTFATSVDAFFEESERYNTRMITGKVLQDRNLPDSLKDPDTEESIVITEQLLKKWHHRGRQLYAVIPRFAPTSTNQQLKLAGELYQSHKDEGVYLHTHLNEAEGEVAWVARLFPEFPNYTEVYKAFGMVDKTTVMAHCCLMREEEWGLMHAADAGVAHCPSSNLFLGDGEFKYWEAKNTQRPIRFGIGTDVGGGTNFSVIRQLNESYKVAMLNTKNLTALQSFYMATRGGAEVLHLENRIGSLAPGYEADIAILDLKPSEFIEWRLQFSETLFDKLFVLMTLALDNLNKTTYIAGKKVFDRSRKEKFQYANQL